jgi:TonB family protein
LNEQRLAYESYRAAVSLYEGGGQSVPQVLLQKVADRDVMPLQRSAPSYPLEAMRKRQCGWVKIGFDISEEGFVQNARVATSSDKVFDAPALAAIRQWQYAPRLENGVPVSRRQVQTTIRFQVEGVGLARCETDAR